MTRISDLLQHPALRQFAANVKNTDLRELVAKVKNADPRALADRLKTADPLNISGVLENVAHLRDTRATAAIATIAGAAVITVSAVGAASAMSTSDAAAVTAFKSTSMAQNFEATAQTAKALHMGKTTASYFWDDASGRAGDTGMPAIGKPMQRGLAASPSWPLGTEGYVTYNGKTLKFFIGDRGPGKPSERGVMLDLDAKTFAELTEGVFDPVTLTVKNNGGSGHIDITYKITKWGPGVGKKGAPVPFSTGAWNS
ncbi:hypothetical protein Aple_039980 [Acrocarpospora pleiomorpha]|uniref:Uncharacterized protein n=1 Tax=Acrocarpospora pleiomorpha TaxID=90975 RepID=A0A5M3XJU7_9ACTN|nr:hypothetical protein [Acrocarpospora pleiomorpha]GES21102.1 hypothetical protein Aple_039980 [Acrocarpospora pleiomorpha]